MAKIFYSMAGEGRGHAVRVRTMVEQLRRDHQLFLFAPDDAYEFLARFYMADGPDVRLVRIPGLKFHYSERKLNLAKSIQAGLWYAFWELPRLVRVLQRHIRREQPDLVITDFDPALPRAARRCGVPVMSLDHQYLLRAYDLTTLPRRLQFHAWSMSFAVWLYYSGQTATVVSSFYTPPLKKGWEHVRPVGPMIRSEVAEQKPKLGDYLLSYLRPHAPAATLEALQAASYPVKVYGLGGRPPLGNLTFHTISEQGFVDDLAGCRAVIAAAGNQLLGESLYLGKPFLAIPERHHHEQMINAHFLQQSGAGEWRYLEKFSAEDVRDFLSRLTFYDQKLTEYRGRLNGTSDALRIVQELLAKIGPACSTGSSASTAALRSMSQAAVV